ncbi:MAG TPA: PhzF family phenazine biosynthesis protein [Burkholderiales bacterium]
MAHRFFIADVFTERPFTGNQLAVFPDGRGISDRAMQAIAREFNFAETTFVLPPRDPKNAAHVRIFTPTSEMPFAGHPTVGTAAVLTRMGRVDAPATIVLEERVGLVPVEIAFRGDALYAHLIVERPIEAPAVQPPQGGAAAALSLYPSTVLESWFASGGVRFCFVRLTDRAAVDRAVLDRAAWTKHFANAWSSQLYFFSGEREQLYARMFAPALGVEEDPATGSGAVAVAGVLAARLSAADGIFTWRIDQGVAMGRPSVLEASAEKLGGKVLRIKVGGATVITGEGTMEVPASY